MFSLFNVIKKSSQSVKIPSHWYDPAALPGPPILVLAAQDNQNCSNRGKTVRWWNKHTPTVVGVASSPTLSQDAPSQGDSMHPVYGFNIQTGSSYLPDFDGDISWDTIDCSTEEGGYTVGLASFSSIYSSDSDATLRPGNLSGSCSSSSSDSNLSMVITDVDQEESFYFPAVESLEEFDKQDDVVATALVLEDLLAMEEEREETTEIPFGDGYPPRRTSTITRLVGEAIRNRRSKFELAFADVYGAETSIRPYQCGQSRRCIPHILTPIIEENED